MYSFVGNLRTVYPLFRIGVQKLLEKGKYSDVLHHLFHCYVVVLVPGLDLAEDLYCLGPVRGPFFAVLLHEV